MNYNARQHIFYNQSVEALRLSGGYIYIPSGKVIDTGYGATKEVSAGQIVYQSVGPRFVDCRSTEQVQ
jgi:hypothetical protein